MNDYKKLVEALRCHGECHDGCAYRSEEGRFEPLLSEIRKATLLRKFQISVDLVAHKIPKVPMK